MKLSENDKKLLTYVYHNQREPLTKISKDIGMSRIQVEYKLNKFFKEGIIENFLTFYDYGSFGYKVYVLLFIKLEKYSSLQDFSKKLEKNKNCISFGECFGKYDLYANLIFKNEEELSNFLSELINGKEQVLDHLIIKPYLAEFHPLKMFYSNKKPILPLVFKDSQEKKFNGNDLKLLR